MMTRQQRRAAERAAAKGDPRRRVTVLVTTDADRFASVLLPPTNAVERGGGRLYSFYGTGPNPLMRYDDIDGQNVVESRTFETLEDARTWVAEDVRQRQAMLAAEGRTQ